MLKGRTKIELTNVHTGKKEEYIHDNMITNAVADMFTGDGVSLPRANCVAFSKYNTIADDLFGGVMLWQEQLSSEASDYMLPLTNTCIGYATRDLENTTSKNLKLGSFNASESSETLKEFKYVWDFNTSQANGQISAVSLVPKIMGQMGIDTPFDQLDDSKRYNDNSKFTSTSLEMVNTPSDNISHETLSMLILGIHDNVRYELYGPNLYLETGYEDKYIKNNGKKLTLIKRKFPNSQITIGQDCKKIIDCHALDISESDKVDIQLPDSYDVSSPGFSGMARLAYPYLYFYSTSEYKNKSITLAKINVVDNSVEIINIPDFPCYEFMARTYQSVTGGIRVSYRLTNPLPTILDNYLIVSGAYNKVSDISYPIYYYDLTNIALGKRTVKDKNSNKDIIFTTGDGTGGEDVGITIKDKFVAVFVEDSDSRVTAPALIYVSGQELYCTLLNATTNIRETNLYRHTESSYYLSIPLLSEGIKNYETNNYVRSQWFSGEIYYMTNPFFLSTKNNLETPVTKTSEQTMKVTYTITEV